MRDEHLIPNVRRRSGAPTLAEAAGALRQFTDTLSVFH
jgi:hypothetical protein